jgi:hypothetical protein
MELRVRLRYKSTSDFGKGDHLNFDKSLAHALEWLYDEDQFEDERTWLYCMEGVLPIYIMMSIVTDVFTFALQDYAETNIKDYILRMEEGNNKHGWNDNKPTLIHLGDEIVLGKVHTFTSEVIIWATYLYASFRADIEEDNEKLKKAKNVLYKLFWKKTGMKEEFVKDTFLMKHFDQTIRDFAMDVLHRYKDDKPAADNKPKQTPVNNQMEGSVLNYISATEMRFYYEGWRNGKHGAICQWDGIYRFVEQARGKSGVLDDVKRNKDDNPIVAIGIVAYWLQFNSRMDTVIKQLTKYRSGIPKDIREQFDTYTQIRFEQFRKEHRDDPNTWDWDWEREFYTNVIIPHEIAFNKQSEALFDYISDSDIALVRGVMNSYIKYLKKTRTEKGYLVNPELLVLRAIDSGDETKQEDLEEFEVNTILDTLEEKRYIQVAWIEGHRPEAVRLLDKGRVYLKHLEEGSDVVESKPVVTPQQPPKENTSEIPPQTPQMPQAPKGSGQEEKEDEKWDKQYDFIFDQRVKPQEIKRAIETVKSEKIRDRRFYYVSFRILKVLKWIPIDTLESDYLKWINCHFECGWEKNKNQKKAFLFNLEGTVKVLDDLHPSEWEDDSLYGKLGKHYRLLALSFKNVFTMTIVNGKPDGESESYEHLRDRVEFLYGTRDVCGTLWAPEEAYVNDGK